MPLGRWTRPHRGHRPVVREADNSSVPIAAPFPNGLTLCREGYNFERSQPHKGDLLGSVFSIRRIDHDDWLLWRTVRLEALADAPEAFGSTLDDWRNASADRWRSRLLDVPLNLIAMIDDQPIGQASATAMTSSRSVGVVSVWVARRQRGTGVGDALIEAAASWAIDERASQLELSVKRAGHPAIALYQRHGFSITDDGDAADEVRMIRRIGPSADEDQP